MGRRRPVRSAAYPVCLARSLLLRPSSRLLPTALLLPLSHQAHRDHAHRRVWPSILPTTETCSPHRAHKYRINISTDLQVLIVEVPSSSKGFRPRRPCRAIWSGGRHAQHGGGGVMRGPVRVRAAMHVRAEPALQRDCAVPPMTRCGISCGVADGRGCGRPAWAGRAVMHPALLVSHWQASPRSAYLESMEPLALPTSS